MVSVKYSGAIILTHRGERSNRQKKMTRSEKIAEKTMTRARRARALEKGVRLSLLVGLESVEPKTTTRVSKKPKRDDRGVVVARSSEFADHLELDEVTDEYVAAVEKYCAAVKRAQESVGDFTVPRRSVQRFFDCVIDRSSGQMLSYIVQPRTLKIPKFRVGFRSGDIVNIGSDRIMGNVFELDRMKANTEPRWIVVKGHSFVL